MIATQPLTLTDALFTLANDTTVPRLGTRTFLSSGKYCAVGYLAHIAGYSDAQLYEEDKILSDNNPYIPYIFVAAYYGLTEQQVYLLWQTNDKCNGDKQKVCALLASFIEGEYV